MYRFLNKGFTDFCLCEKLVLDDEHEENLMINDVARAKNSSLTFGWRLTTHRKMTKKAFKYLDEQGVKLHPLLHPKRISKNSMWPDFNENEFKGKKYHTAHYFDPKKPVKSWDAWDMLVQHFNNAFDALKDGDKKKFNNEVGRFAHYFQDGNVPHHTFTNKSLHTHFLYEEYADYSFKKNLKNAKQHKNFSLDLLSVKPLKEFIKDRFIENANFSRPFFPEANTTKKKKWERAISETFPRALASTIEMLNHLNNHLHEHFPPAGKKPVNPNAFLEYS